MVMDFSKMTEESRVIASEAYDKEDWITLRAISAKHLMMSSSDRSCCSVKDVDIEFKQWWEYARRKNII